MRIFSLLLCFIGFSIQAQKLEISHLTGDFYVYTTYNSFNWKPYPSNSMYLVTGEGVVMFDTPWDEKQFQPLLDSIQKRHGKKVVLCLATHYHADRTAGLEFLKAKGIKTYTSKQTYDLCKQFKESQPEFYFKKDTVFKVGRYNFETFYPGKGHTKDNIVIWFPNEKVLYGGCFVKSTEHEDLGNLSDADVRAWPKSIRKVLKKCPDPRYVIPGHLDWKNSKSLEHTLKMAEEYNSTR